MCTCDHALELINEKIDQCISQNDDAVLCSHLSTCPACRSVLESYMSIQQDMIEMQVEPPRELASQVMERIRTEIPTKRHFPFKTVAGFLTCAAALALVLGLGGVAGLLSMNYDTADTVSNTSGMPPVECAADDEIGDTVSAWVSGESYSAQSADTEGTQMQDAVTASGTMKTVESVDLSTCAAILTVSNMEDLGVYSERLTFDHDGVCLTSISLAVEIRDHLTAEFTWEENSQEWVSDATAAIVISQK